MKKVKTIITILIMFMFIISSCTVQKRLYRNGYSISWNNSFVSMNKDGKGMDKKAEIDSSSITEVDLVEEKVAATKPIEKTNMEYASIENDIVDINSTRYESDLISQKILTVNENILSNEPSQINSKLLHRLKKKNVESEQEDTEKKPINGWALTAFIFSLISLFTTFWGALACAILVLVFTKIAQKQFKENPDKYRGQKLAFWALIITSVSMILWSVYFIVVG